VELLVVEDDQRIAAFLVKGLAAEGYGADVAGDGETALHRLDSHTYDLVLLDLGLPGTSGEDVLGHLRRRNIKPPVIILTARSEVADKIRGLDLGATDYVTKPFSFEELLARIRAALRTASQRVATELVVGDLRLDLLTKLAWRAGRQIELSPREWSLLELFMRHPTHVLTRARIASEVFGYAFDPGSNVVDVYVGYLRRKLNQPGLEPLIKTVRGAGYRFVAP
jgi:two-component system OmpR family response regulator